jgi:hypothetical protein
MLLGRRLLDDDRRIGVRRGRHELERAREELEAAPKLVGREHLPRRHDGRLPGRPQLGPHARPEAAHDPQRLRQHVEVLRRRRLVDVVEDADEELRVGIGADAHVVQVREGFVLAPRLGGTFERDRDGHALVGRDGRKRAERSLRRALLELADEVARRAEQRRQGIELRTTSRAGHARMV